MIRIQGKIPRNVYVACSGGVDSIATAHFLMNNHDVTLLFFDHGTETSYDALEFVKDFAVSNAVKLEVGNLSRLKENHESLEEYWRKERYNFFHSFDREVITSHHLDDCVETWIWSSLHGEGKIIPYRNKNVIRPFRLNRKSQFINWCKRKKVSWIEDTTNQDTKYMRNYIRHEIVPKTLVVNPGIHTVIAKKIAQE